MKRFKILFTFLITILSLFVFISPAFAAESPMENKIKSEITSYVSSGELPSWHLKYVDDEGYQTYYWERCHLSDYFDDFKSKTESFISFIISMYKNETTDTWDYILSNLDIDPSWLESNKYLGLYWDSFYRDYNDEGYVVGKDIMDELRTGIHFTFDYFKATFPLLVNKEEIERENIIEQTMNGRREKARQGGWNGGFAPYGYELVNGKLVINEYEAAQVRTIFDLYANTSMGYNSVVKEMNLRGSKVKRQNGKNDFWGVITIRRILDNPVYTGKIAFGRRTKEKIKGTRDGYRTVHSGSYILEEGQHEAIISEEIWNIVREKRERTGVKHAPI